MKNATPATKAVTKLAIAALEDVKGANIEVIDVSPLTSVTDHMIICTGTSSRHVKALADAVMEKALEAGIRPLSSQGLEQGEWALVDLNGTVVHVMLATARATYQLEKLWDMGQPKPKLAESKPAESKPVKKSAGKTAKKAANKTAAKPAAKRAAKVAAVKSPTKKPASRKPASARPAVAGKAKRPGAAKPASVSSARAKPASRSAKPVKSAKPAARKGR